MHENGIKENCIRWYLDLHRVFCIYGDLVGHDISLELIVVNLQTFIAKMGECIASKIFEERVFHFHVYVDGVDNIALLKC